VKPIIQISYVLDLTGTSHKKPFDSRAKALSAKRSEKGYGDENERTEEID